jgi:hypothetical protein
MDIRTMRGKLQPPQHMIAYLTDVEGRWDKVISFTANNPHVSLVNGALVLSDGVIFVFGGDAIDRGPYARRFVALLLAAKKKYGERVVFLAGNRDINKTRLLTELRGKPHRLAPPDLAGAELLKWTFANTMGASKAFEYRAQELKETGAPFDDDAVVSSYLADLSPGGELHEFLKQNRLAWRAGATLFLHGGLTAENFLQLPDAPHAQDVDSWIDSLNRFYRDELAVFETGKRPDALIQYQSQGPDKLNQQSVVYARPTDDCGNPFLPPREIIERLRSEGIRRLVVGHTPSGDCPSILRDGEFELVLADNSYGRIEQGSQVFITDDETQVRALTQLDDGQQAKVEFTSHRKQSAPLGLRDRDTGQLVKARLASGEYLLFRGLPKFCVEQVSESADQLSSRTLVTPHAV